MPDSQFDTNFSKPVVHLRACFISRCTLAERVIRNCGSTCTVYDKNDGLARQEVAVEADELPCNIII